MNTKDNPYEYHNDKLGFKVKFLISDKRDRDDKSLKLIRRRTLNHRMNSKTCTEKRLRSGSWAHEALVLFDSLDQTWRELIIQHFGEAKKKVAKSYFAKHYNFDGEAKDFFVKHRFGEDNNRSLDLETVMLYTYQASVLNTVLEVKNNRKAYAKALGGVKLNIWETLSRDVNAFKEVDHQLPTTPDSLRYKVNKYVKNSYDSLISRKYANKNASRIIDSEQFAFIDELIGKHTNLDNETIAEIYNATAKIIGWKKISSGTIANRKKDKDLVTYAGRNGVKALKNNVLMQNKRKKPSASMLFWSVDGWDVELLYQDTKVNKEGNRVTTYTNRLTVVLILDPFNKYPVGYAIGTHETPQLIEKALKNTIEHTQELFGDYYKTYQLQTDNYAIKRLTPTYQSITKHFTPASVGNAKSKPVEPYFNFLNKKYCKLYDNWSGHNIDSGSKNQPNAEYLNKIRHQFPTKLECTKQIIAFIETERAKKVDEFTHSFEELDESKKIKMTWEEFMLTFGETTQYKNTLEGDGVTITINGKEYYYDSFEPSFRQHRKVAWKLYYNLNDLSKVLAVSPCTQYRFQLEQKYVQAMCIADQKDEDHLQLQKVENYNNSIIDSITKERSRNADILKDFFDRNPELNDTMGKMLLTNSLGQHKNEKNKSRLLQSAQKVEVRQSKKRLTERSNGFNEKQQQYYNDKINVNDYL